MTRKEHASMISARAIEKPIKVGELISQRLGELERTPEELAEAVDVPCGYIEDLISGKRRPPRPARTDVYERMTTFLRLARNDLAMCANAEREAEGPVTVRLPKPAVRRMLLDLCEPETAQELERGSGKEANSRLADYCQRILDRAQAVVRRRMLADPTALRLSAQQSNETRLAMRMQILDFLDAASDTLTPNHLKRFIQPWVAAWDVDFETGVLRIVMHGHDHHMQRPSAPSRI